MLSEGTMLGGRYEILSRIGSGGMADVYKGKDRKLNRFIAVKVLKREFHEDDSFIRKFTSEAQAAGGLMHPNVVNVYDVGEDRGFNYMVMELVEGITLKEYIMKKGKLSAKEAVSIAIQIANGIQAAHNQNIIHRDIKPQNVIISKEGKVKVTDFGIAKAANSNTVSSMVMGSVHYSSPEQARGAASDAKSDIYSLGITMYEMVTGRLPFDGDTAVSVAVKHLQEEIISPAEYVPELPYSLEQIILKCTQKRADFRYPDVAALILDLKRSLVEPEGDFVRIRQVAGAATVMITEEELQEIQRKNMEHRYHAYNDSHENRYDDRYEYEDDYDDEYDEYEDEYDDDYDDEYEDDYRSEGRRHGKGEQVNPGMNRIIRILMIVVALIIGFLIVMMAGKAAGLFKLPGSNWSDEAMKNRVEVPDVVGKTKDEGIAALNKVNLGYELVEGGQSDRYDKGYIMEQETAAGTKVLKNTRIKIVVSSGMQPQEIEMPDVTGQDEKKARATLENLGLVVSTTSEYNEEYEKGKVLYASYEPGTRLEKGTEVTLTVSDGREPVEKVEVPGIVDMMEWDAVSALQYAGLTAGERKEEFSDAEPGTVIKQDISVGNKVEIGGSVGYTVSKGREKTKMPPVNGLTESRAKAVVQGAGFEPVFRYEVNESAAGTVFYSSFDEGTELDPGTVVEIWISTGMNETPQEEAPKEESQPEASEEAKPQDNAAVRSH